jgi:hypothetical protein
MSIRGARPLLLLHRIAGILDHVIFPIGKISRCELKIDAFLTDREDRSKGLAAIFPANPAGCARRQCAERASKPCGHEDQKFTRQRRSCPRVKLFLPIRRQRPQHQDCGLAFRPRVSTCHMRCLPPARYYAGVSIGDATTARPTTRASSCYVAILHYCCNPAYELRLSP